MASKLLFICKERKSSGGDLGKGAGPGSGYGRSIGLINSAQFIVNYLTSIKVQCKLAVVVDANSIDREMSRYKPTHVILEAIWVTPLKLKELMSLKKYAGVKWVVRIHSKVPFIANEGIAFPWIVEYTKLMKDFPNLFLSVNSPEFVEDLEKMLHARTVYLPNIYFPDDAVPKVKMPKKNHFDVGCFGAIRPMKNHLIQAVAAIKYGEETNQIVHFHINADRQEQSGDNVYKNLKALFAGTRHKLIDHPWLARIEFLEVIDTMDLGLQVSLSETFNIVVADFIYRDVPIIGSKDITWLPEEYKASPNYSEDILERMRLIVDTKPAGDFKRSKMHLNWYNDKSKKIWRDFLI